MARFLILFVLLLISIPNACSRRSNAEDSSTQGSEHPRDYMDLLMAAHEENAELPEEIRKTASQAGETDTVKLIDVNAERETPRQKQSNPETCLPKLDLVFLLDSSGSIRRIFQEHVRWAVALVDSLPIEPDTVRVAAVQYSGFPLTEFALGSYPSVDDIRLHLEKINFRKGVSRTGYALRKAEAELFRPDRGARDDALKVIVIFSDGLSIDDPLKPAQQLRDLKGVKIYVVSLKTDIAQMNKIAGGNENVFGPGDLKRLRDVLISEAEKIRACIRIGNVVRPFNNPFINGAISPQASNWFSIGQNGSVFKNDLKDIIELSRAAAAIAAARPGMLGGIKEPTTLLPASKSTSPTQTKRKATSSSSTMTITTPKTLQSSTSTPTAIKSSSTTFRPFLGVRVIEEVEQDVFEEPSNKSTTLEATTIMQSSTIFKASNEYVKSRKEFTTTRKPIPVVQNAVPLLNVIEEKTTYVPTWRRTPSTTRVPLTSTITNRPQTVRIRQSNNIQLFPETVSRLNSSFPTLRPVQTSETTTHSTMLVTRPKISRVNLFPGVTCPHDILFLVDSSGSVQKSYELQKAYLRDILSRIQIGNETHRVALLQFAGYRIQKTEWTYNSFADSPDLMHAIERIRYLTGTTFIGAALNSARQILEQRRKGIPSLVILLSDGYSQDDAVKAAEQIRQLNNLELYALSVNSLSNKDYLAQMVGSQNVFSGDETEDLKHLVLNRLHCRF